MEGLPEEQPRSESRRKSSGDRSRRRERKPEKPVIAMEAAASVPQPPKVQIEQHPLQHEPRLAATRDATQLPAFLMRPVKLPPRPVKPLATAEAD
jgi:hypothetical protein